MIGLVLAVRYIAGLQRLVSLAGLAGMGATIFATPFLVAVAGRDGIWLPQLTYGALFYAGAIALILQGRRTGAGATGTVGVAAFIGQTLYVYSETFGGLLDTALFFLVGGLILFAMSYGMWRWKRRTETAPVAPTRGDPT